MSSTVTQCDHGISDDEKYRHIMSHKDTKGLKTVTCAEFK